MMGEFEPRILGSSKLGVAGLLPIAGGAETVEQHFDIGLLCSPWDDNCSAKHDHIHVQFLPKMIPPPLCAGGSGPPPKGGWSYPGSPRLVAFRFELDHRISLGQFPGVFHGSGYNCRYVKGTQTFSEHSGWNALDVQAKVYGDRMSVLRPVRDWIVGPWLSPPKYPGRVLFYDHPVMHGADVTLVKDELKRRHLNAPPMDGTDLFGSATDANVRRFQFAHHLVTDGVVGPKTWAALFPG